MTFKLRRFSDEKQDQVEQLIGYATMLGLSGKDLISIGGKMERDRSNMFIKRNLELIKSVEVYRIGNDVDIEQRFKIKTSNGNYNFENNGYSWHITSLKTKNVINYTPSESIDLPKRMGWYKRCQYRMLYDIATGVIQLNF
jgi:hypothetical protein